MVDETHVQDEFTSSPVMKTIPSGVIVQTVESFLVPATNGPRGSVSVGAGPIPDQKGAVHIAIHHPDGTTLLATLGPGAFNRFARLMNGAAEMIQAGAFAQPETCQ